MFISFNLHLNFYKEVSTFYNSWEEMNPSLKKIYTVNFEFYETTQNADN